MFLEIAKNRMWCRRLLVLSVGLITIVTVIPHGSAATMTVPVVSIDLDKIVHFLGFAALLLLAFAASEQLSLWRGARITLYVLFYGVAIEVVQYYIPYRTFNPIDIFANSCGVVFGVILAHSAKRIAQRGRRMEQSASRLNTLKGGPGSTGQVAGRRKRYENQL